MNTTELTIDQGTINFVIKQSKILFNDHKTTPIFSINPSGGSIFMVKDNDNILKVFFVALNKGRVDLELDVTSLDSTIDHMFTLTWDMVSKKLILYIDGQKKSEKEMIFGTTIHF